MMGIISGEAPQFILLSISFVAMVWIPSVLITAGGKINEWRFRQYFVGLIARAVYPPIVLFILLLIRIILSSDRCGFPTDYRFHNILMCLIDALAILLLSYTMARITSVIIAGLTAWRAKYFQVDEPLRSRNHHDLKNL